MTGHGGAGPSETWRVVPENPQPGTPAPTILNGGLWTVAALQLSTAATLPLLMGHAKMPAVRRARPREPPRTLLGAPRLYLAGNPDVTHAGEAAVRALLEGPPGVSAQDIVAEVGAQVAALPY